MLHSINVNIRAASASSPGRNSLLGACTREAADDVCSAVLFTPGELNLVR
jgi:hypothetical protein